MYMYMYTHKYIDLHIDMDIDINTCRCICTHLLVPSPSLGVGGPLWGPGPNPGHEPRPVARPRLWNDLPNLPRPAHVQPAATVRGLGRPRNGSPQGIFIVYI